MDRQRRTFVLLLAIVLAGVLAPGIAHADNLGGLVYLVFIWPINGLALLVLVVLSIVAGVKLKRNNAAPKSRWFGVVLMVLSAGIAGVCPILTLLLDNSFRARGGLTMIAISSVPVVVIALVCFALGAAWVGRAQAR